MRAFYIFSGLFILIFIVVISLPQDIKEFEVQKNGQLVKVVLQHVPRSKGFIEFDYEGRQYDKKVTNSFHNDYRVGDILVLRHLEGTDIFLFEKETKEGEFIATFLLGLATIFCLYKGLRNDSRR